MAAITDVLCTELEKKLDLVNTTLDTITPGIQLFYKNLKLGTQFLTNITASPQQDMINAMNNLQQDILANVPTGIGDEIVDLLDMMTNCNILDEYINDFGIDGIINGVVGSLFNDISTVLNNAIDLLSNLLEYPAAVLISNYNKYLEKLKINDLIDIINKLIICFSSVCPGNDYSTKINLFFNTLSSLRIDGFGSLDINALYSDIGLTDVQVIDNIQISLSSILTAEQDSEFQTKTELTNLKTAFGF